MREEVVGISAWAVWATSLLASCSSPESLVSSLPHYSPAPTLTADAGYQPGRGACLARNPIKLVKVEITRKAGNPETSTHAFRLPISTPVCVRISPPRAAGHRVTSAAVALDGIPLLGPADFKQSFAGLERSLILPAGDHAFEVVVASKPGTVLSIEASVFGPFIEQLSPLTGDTGTTINLQGEGFFGPLTVTSGASTLTSPMLVSNSEVTAISVAGMPVGALTVTTSLGSGSSTQPFIPSAPGGVVPFYPFADFAIADSGSCVAPSRLRLVQDGSRVGFIVDFYRPLLEDVVLNLGIDNDNRPASIEVPLSVRRTAGNVVTSGTPDILGGLEGSTAVLSATFASLDLHDVETLGRMFVQLSVSSSCGFAAFPSAVSQSDRAAFVEIRSAFAPGVVLVRTTAPTAVAAAHGLRYFVTAEDSDLAAMGVPPGRRLEDVLVELNDDPLTNGATLDPVMYPTNHAVPSTGSSCGIPGPFFETATTPLPSKGQWTLEQIGFEAHPSPLAGSGVVVAVLDTGVDPHPDIRPNLLNGFNVLLLGDGSSTDVDPDGHGTGVASVIAAAQGNGGMVGAAPGAKILPIRVLNRDGLSEGFGLFRAFGIILNEKATSRPEIQVVNVSMQEWVDTILAVTQLGFPSSVGVSKALHDRADLLVRSGVALVVSAGNSGAYPWAPAGMQYPANVVGAFAVGELDNDRNPTPSSTRATGTQRIALAAPASLAGGYAGVLCAEPTGGLATSFGSYHCFNGTSFAAPLVSGAVANVLSPSPPRTSTLATGVAAGNHLVANATPLPGRPFQAVGAGELNLRIPVALRAFSWSFGFQSSAGLIDDFAFLPGVGDFALRSGGMELETSTGPNGVVSSVASFQASRSWMVATSGHLAFGTPSGIEFRSPTGSLIGTIPGPSFRGAVSPFSISGGQLLAISNGAGGARIRLFLGSADLAEIPASSSEAVIGAHWAGMPAFPAEPSAPYVLALRTSTVVRYYGVRADISQCATLADACPVLLGTSDVRGIPGVVVDWAFTAGSLGPTSYFVNGTANVFVAPMNATTLTTVQLGVLQRYIALASNPRIEAVYALDADNTQFAMLRGANVVGVDRSRPAAGPQYGTTSFIRVAPSGTYGYIQTGVGTLGSTRAIFVGLLAP